jgi:multidrug efflux pump subunit AcrA (membrane-fusion protein)
MKFKVLSHPFGVYKITWILLLAFTLAGCGAIAQSTPQALPTVVLDGGSTAPAASGATEAASPSAGNGVGVTASGIVVPAQQAQLASPLAGRVEAVNVAVGDPVAAGDVLVLLAGSEELQAALSGAELDILSAQQELQKLNDDLPEEQASALQELTDAREALRDAERLWLTLQNPASEADINEALATLVLAQDVYEKAQKDFEPYENRSEDNLGRAAMLNRLADAQRKYENARRRYNGLLAGSNEFDKAQAQAELDVARSRLELADEKYKQLDNGPDTQAVSLAEAHLKNAQDRAEAARASLANLELEAPFSGTVTEVAIHSGEWAIPGQPVLVLADLDSLRVETTDLSERDIPKVEPGQPVRVFVEALGEEVAGRVSLISPLADTLGGDVVYKTTIDLDTRPEGLRAGMSVEVLFE